MRGRRVASSEHTVEEGAAQGIAGGHCESTENTQALSKYFGMAGSGLGCGGDISSFRG